MLHFASNWPEGSLALCENETSSFAVLKQQFWIHRTWTKMLIFTEVFSLIGNQVKTLWPLVPLSSAKKWCVMWKHSWTTSFNQTDDG